MVLDPESMLRDVLGISQNEKDEIRKFMQGAIWAWSKNRKGEKFAVYDLMGGDNFHWEDTPLYPLYRKHIRQGKDRASAIKAAGIDLGWIVKSVVAADKRTYKGGKKLGKSGLVNSYEWDGIEPYAANS